MKNTGISRAAANNRANQMNPNNAAYRASRGLEPAAPAPASPAPVVSPDPTSTTTITPNPARTGKSNRP